MDYVIYLYNSCASSLCLRVVCDRRCTVTRPSSLFRMFNIITVQPVICINNQTSANRLKLESWL